VWFLNMFTSATHTGAVEHNKNPQQRDGKVDCDACLVYWKAHALGWWRWWRSRVFKCAGLVDTGVGSRCRLLHDYDMVSRTWWYIYIVVVVVVVV
jgi:hypothetical protein